MLLDATLSINGWRYQKFGCFTWMSLTFHIGKKQTEHRPGPVLALKEKWPDVLVSGFILGRPEHGHFPGLCAHAGLSQWMGQVWKALHSLSTLVNK